jgi:histone H3/H4
MPGRGGREMMAFGNKDTIIAYKMSQEDTREYELPKAPVKRLLQEGSQVIHDQHYGSSKFRMTEGALLTFRRAMEYYALALAEKVGKSTYHHARNTIQVGDIEEALSDPSLPAVVVEMRPNSIDITEPDRVLRLWALETHRLGDLISHKLSIVMIQQKFHNTPLPDDLIQDMEGFIAKTEEIIPEIGEHKDNARILKANAERFRKTIKTNNQLLKILETGTEKIELWRD